MADDGFHASDRKNATFYRCGLQVALLAMRPLRMRNFSAIRLGHHLVRNPAGWELHFGGNETKNRRPIEISFPELLCPFLERYIEVYRKLLAGSGYQGDRLWLGYRFTPQSPHTLQLSIVRVTSQAFGQPVNPHLFRDCVATAIAFHDPKRVRMAAILLGHASFGTTQKYYNLAGGLEAGQEYARVLAERRRRV
jgi:integrase